MGETIKSVSQYISEVKSVISRKGNDSTIVYRGEDIIYPYPCRPNIFRGEYLKRNKYFEKNLFEEMSANKLTNGDSYLEKAIDAQHDGFPSRLLDVTYNSLVALYFATTPYFHKPEISNDHEDGAVYIYSIERLFCPSGNNINSIYNSIVNRDIDWFSDNYIFQKNHKLIDHVKSNKRIIAQQGAFILFQGDEASSIPDSDYHKIVIDKGSKKIIRKELDLLFGIHTGSIYPEASNLVSEITRKSYKIFNNEFSFENEVDLVIVNFEREVEFFSRLVTRKVYKDSSQVELSKLIIYIEELIYTYKIGLENIRENIDKNNYKINDTDECETISKAIERYHELLSYFKDSVLYHIKDKKIKISYEELKIK